MTIRSEPTPCRRGTAEPGAISEVLVHATVKTNLVRGRDREHLDRCNLRALRAPEEPCAGLPAVHRDISSGSRCSGRYALLDVAHRDERAGTCLRVGGIPSRGRL
jgi:hypothetical protein